jgi:MFS family permease
MLLWSMLVMEVPTGILADRLGHRASYTLALILGAAGEGIFLLAHDYPTFLATQFISGTGFAFASGSVSAIVYESLPAHDRPARMQRAWGKVGAATQAASVLAYSIGGWITADQSMPRMRVTLAMGMIALGIAAALSLFLHKGVSATHAAKPTSLGLLKTAWGTIRGNPALRRLILFSLVTNTFTAHLLVFYQQYFLESAVPGIWFGLALSLGSVVAIGTQYFAWRLVPLFGSNRALLISAIVPAILYLMMAVTHHPALAVGLFVVQWGAAQLAAPLFAGLFNQHLPDAARATSLSLISGISTVYIGIGGILLGWMSEKSLPITFVVIGSIAIGGCIVMRHPDGSRPVATAKG